MRETIYRGKRLDNCEWVEGQTIVVIHQDDNDLLFMPQQGEDVKADIMDGNDRALTSIYGNYYQILPQTVGQFTGLTDKNSKKIFEGDCFKTYCTGLPVYKHIVGYYPEHFAFMARCIEMNTVHYLSDYRPSAIEVIGNIHDNPELLEVAE